MCKCTCGWPVYTDASCVVDCPQCKSKIVCSGDGLSDILETGLVQVGLHTTSVNASHWLSLHRYAIDNWDSWDADKAKEYYQYWERTIPSLNCSCRENWRKYTQARPGHHTARFTTPEKFFEMAWEDHNYVSKNHAGKPTISLGECRALYEYPLYAPVEDVSAPLTNPNAIITVAAGNDYERLLEVSVPLMEEYAKRVQADVIVLTGRTQGWWGLEKLRMTPYVEQYERSLFVDCDVLIKPDAPNIFEHVPSGHIGMHDDAPHISSLEWAVGERSNLWQSQGLDDWQTPYMLNTGVIVLEPLHVNILTPPLRKLPGRHCDEQFWIERQCEGHKVFHLDRKFNHQWYWKDFEEKKDSAYFVHYANCPNDKRFDQMKEYAKSAQRAVSVGLGSSSFNANE